MKNYSLIISIYAALVATVALLWNIIVYIFNSLGKLKVSHSVISKILSHNNMGKQENLGFYLDVRITNLGKNIRYIDNYPSIVFKKKNKELKNFMSIDPNNIIKFPRLIKPSEIFTHEFNLLELKNKLLLDLNRNEKIWIMIKDTHGKKYCSSKIKVSTLINYK